MSSAPDTDIIASLLVHLGRGARPAEAETEGLSAAHWAALRYFASANAPSRTPSAFARFHATSRGTASQTVRALVARGLLVRTPSGADRRSVRIDLTEAGASALAADPARRLSGAIAALPEDERRRFAAAAARLVQAVDAARGQPGFGLCPDCDSCTAGADTPHWCCRHRAALTPADLSLLCADFTPRAEAAS